MPAENRERLGGVEQTSIVLFGGRGRAHGAELDEAEPIARFALRAVVADREGREPARALDQHGVAEPLRVRRGDFIGKIETRIEAIGHLAAGAQGFGLFLGVKSAEPRGAGDRPGLPRRREHEGGQEPRIEAELLIEAHVLGALSKGEEPAVRDAPSVELLDGPGEQRLGDSPVVQIRAHRQGAKKADAAPSRGEVGADEAAVEADAESGDMGRPPAAINIVAVSPEGLRIRRAEERAERDPDDAFRLRQIAFRERSDRGLRAYVVRGYRHGASWLSGTRPPGGGPYRYSVSLSASPALGGLTYQVLSSVIRGLALLSEIVSRPCQLA
jgi:hypothetical protein